MLVGVEAADPLSFGVSALFFLAVTLLASYWPARRAVAVDPQTAVRYQWPCPQAQQFRATR